jgi:crotonobetainyl-CoA hydratase
MPDLLYEKRDHYAIFTMNRPERLNALGGSMQEDLVEAIADFEADPEMRAGIVTGAGRAFCAGADLKESNEKFSAGQTKPVVRLEPSAPYSLAQKPFIAAVNGLAVGGGLERALDCDIRICSTDAYFGLFEPKRGIMAGYATKHLARCIGLSAANYILLTADRIEPQQALKWGIVTEVLEPERLLPRAEEIASMIVENAPLSIEGTKAQILEWRLHKADEARRLGDWVGKVVRTSEDSIEGPRAFAEKRDPVWQGR